MRSQGRRMLVAVLLSAALGATIMSPMARAQEGKQGGREEPRRAEGIGGSEVPLPPKEEIAKLPPDGGEAFNRLIFESSPYLLQHARNPVDWYPWGDAAFEKAKDEDKPVFLSIGYSTCHWCHVMERESFEDDVIAGLMNEHFVCVKVDREERPDVDAVYMAAVQAMRGRGGWPMSVFLTPQRRPFWAATYLPPEARHGGVGFKTVLERIAHLWQHERDRLLKGADELTSHIRSRKKVGEEGELSAATLEAAFKDFEARFDEIHGGFGGAPKFPRSHSLSFLLRYHKRSGDKRALEMVETTLEHMARGGMYDHLGGGFHRYSTDRRWLVPHFEKMLYDQALLSRTFMEAFQVTGKERYADIAREVFDYVLRDMTGPEGGFYSAEDADSEGVEGKFYLWPRSEIMEVLGAKDGELFSRVYGVTAEGNYREEVTGEATGSNILHVAEPPEQVVRELEMEFSALVQRLAAMRAKLYEVREERVHPHKDDKVLTAWNGLMIGSLAYGGRVLQEPRYTGAARRTAAFIMDRMVRDGRLLRSYRQGEAGINGYLKDHAFLCLGLLELYQATFEVRWLREARDLAGAMIKLFWDSEEGGFHVSGKDAERLIARTKEVYDGAVPSGNSAATLALLKLGRLTMDEKLEEHARGNLERFSGQVSRFPMGYPFMLMALGFEMGPTREVVLAGPREGDAVGAMHRALSRRFLPNLVLAFHPEGDAGREIEAMVPFLEGLEAAEGRGTAYVCQGGTCSLPVTGVGELLGLIEDGGGEESR